MDDLNSLQRLKGDYTMLNIMFAYKDTIEETGNAIYFEKYDVEKVCLEF